MPSRITKNQVLFAAIAALLAAGLACGSIPAQPGGAEMETEPPGVQPTWPPTWTPTWTPTPAPTNSPTAVPTSALTVDALPTSVAPTAVLPLLDFPVAGPDDLQAGVTEMGCDPSEDTLIEAAQGMEADRCVLYVRMDEMSVRFSDELVQLMLEDEGVTPEDIRQMEEEANQKLAEFQGRDGVCRFDSTEDLTAWLGAMKEGVSYGYSGSCKLVDGEWQCDEGEGSPECVGELFESASK
jgi:hypothetical protein